MEQIDKMFINELRKDSRQTLTQVSSKIKVPVTTLFYRLAKLDNYVKKNTVLLNYDDLGYAVRLHLALKVAENDFEKLQKFLISEEVVNSLYRIKDYDYYVELVFANSLKAYDFVKQLKKNFIIQECEEIHVVKEVDLEMLNI